MNFFFSELHRRNPLLYWVGWLLMVTFLAGLFISVTDDRMINGFSVWNTPLKYILSSMTTVWTFGWILEYLRSKTTIRIFSRLIAFSISSEIIIMLYRALRLGESYFPLPGNNNIMLYYVMLLMVALYSLTFIAIAIAFFRQKKMPISQHYTWAVRLSMVSFLLMMLSGGIMIFLRTHNFGGKDDDSGWMLFNFSTHFGDMRVAHFMAIHSLQIIPLTGYYIFTKKNQVIGFSIVYMLFMLAMMIMASLGMPLIPIK